MSETKVKDINENSKQDEQKKEAGNIDWSSLIDYSKERIEYFLNLSGQDILDLDDQTFKAEREELQDIVDRFGKSMGSKQYETNLTTNELKILRSWLEKYAPWNNKNAAQLSACVNSIDKVFSNATNDQENVKLGRVIITTSYNFLISAYGEGYRTAKEYIRVLTHVGEKITNASKDIQEEDHYFRELHSVLALFDQRNEGILKDSIEKQKQNESESESENVE